MAADLDPTTFTAVRTWTRSPYPKANVHVRIGEELYHAGGNRAARCNYAIVWQRSSGSWGLLGLRSEPKGEGSVRWHAVPIVDELEGRSVQIIADPGQSWLPVERVAGAAGCYVRKGRELVLVPHHELRRATIQPGPNVRHHFTNEPDEPDHRRTPEGLALGVDAMLEDLRAADPGPLCRHCGTPRSVHGMGGWCDPILIRDLSISSFSGPGSVVFEPMDPPNGPSSSSSTT